MELRLRPLRVGDEPQANAAHAELADGGFTFLLLREQAATWSEYVAMLRDHRRGLRVPDGMVPATFLIAEVGSELVGRVSIRHQLNDWLARIGGHIGYGVRPDHRRHGYATEILRQALIIARAEGVERALVVCDEGNVASGRAIERCGGVLEGVVDADDGGPKRRYWID